MEIWLFGINNLLIPESLVGADSKQRAGRKKQSTSELTHDDVTRKAQTQAESCGSGKIFRFRPTPGNRQFSKLFRKSVCIDSDGSLTYPFRKQR
jgi:hypothetical protein